MKKYILIIILLMPLFYIGQSMDSLQYHYFTKEKINLNLPIITETEKIPTNFIIKKYKFTYKKGKVKVIKPIDWKKIQNRIREEDLKDI